MKRIDFAEWVQAHGCELIPYESINGTAYNIKIRNKLNGRESYLELPLTSPKPMRDAHICTICLNLIIPVPDGIVCNAAEFRK